PEFTDAARVLGHQRRHHRGAVSAESRERLQVCLDAGAAAGIGPGDGEDVRNHRPLPSRIAWRSASAAARGSGAPQMAETTARPSAPARITLFALAASMPPMAITGRSME